MKKILSIIVTALVERVGGAIVDKATKGGKDGDKFLKPVASGLVALMAAASLCLQRSKIVYLA